VAAWLLAGCAGSPFGLGGDQCRDSPGSYPPATITVTGAEPVAVPWTSWSCLGYDADTFEGPVPVALGGDTVRMDVPIEDGAELEVRFDGTAVDVDPGASSQAVVVPPAASAIFVRLCTDDGRCANYEAVLDRASLENN
jgi:hypothetical protein